MTELQRQTEEIHRLLLRGWNNGQIYSVLGMTMYPHLLEDEQDRREAAELLEMAEVPSFDHEAKTLVTAQIKKLRNLYATEIAKAELGFTPAEDDDDAVVSMANVQETYTERVTTGCHRHDMIFGSSKRYDEEYRVVGEDWGMPLGKLGILGGEEGVGKTRWYSTLFLAEIMRTMNLPHEERVASVVFQGEMEPGEYKELLMSLARAYGKKLPEEALCYILCSKSSNVYAHAKLIQHGTTVSFPDGSQRLVKPKIAVVDSFPMIKGHNTSEGIENIVFQWKKALAGRCFGLMITHLNSQKGFKGNNLIRYLADSTYLMKLEQWLGKGYFSLTTCKTRHGKRDEKMFFSHDPEKGRVILYPDWYPIEPAKKR